MKFFIKIISIFIFVQLTNQLRAQDYLWPTNASHYLTSSFAEYRPGHFHAGIDIKTWGKIGYKVFAVRDGYISRIRVSPFGYGKVLYQKLDTGETAVYAHLNGFNEELEHYIKQQQKRNRAYRVNKYLKSTQFPVKKGEVIGYTGATGIGYPHLHFEMRDEYSNPINPFLRGYKVKDTIPPEVTGIAISPLDHTTRVNGDAVPHIEKPKRISVGNYELESVPVVSGMIGFAVNSFDQANGVNNKFAAYKLDFYVDGDLRFSATYNKFSYSNSHFIDFDRDYRLNTRGLGLYQKLYKDEFNELPIYRPEGENIGKLICEPGTTDGNGRSDILSAGEHQFRIELYDFFGNVTTIKGAFIVGSRPRLMADFSTDEPGQLIVSDVMDETGMTIMNPEFYISLNPGDSWRKVEPQRIEDAAAGNSPPQSAFMLTPVQPGMILKIQSLDEHSILSFPLFHKINEIDASVEEVPQISIENDFYDDFVRVIIRTTMILPEMPILHVQQIGLPSTEVELWQNDVKTYAGIYKLIPGRNGPLSFDVTATDCAGNELYSWDQIDVETVTPSHGGKIVSKDDNCAVSFSSNEVYDFIFLRIDHQNKLDDPQYDSVGDVYEVHPQDIPFKGRATIQLKYPESDINPEKLGIYRKGKSKWGFNGNTLDEKNYAISCNTSSFGTYTLIRDEIPPVVELKYPNNNIQLSQKRPTFTAVVYDELSGVADERSIVMKIDGNEVIAGFDPETKTVKYKPDEPLLPGNHTFSVRAFDNSKNETEVVYNFVILD